MVSLSQEKLILEQLNHSGIIKDTQGRLRLVDFGIARIYKTNKPEDTEPMGSALTASPEHFGGRQTDERSDIYTLGATLHYLATNGNSFSGQLFEFESPRAINPKLSESFDKILMKCLDQEPEKRYQSIAELRAALGGPRGEKAAEKEAEAPAGPPKTHSAAPSLPGGPVPRATGKPRAVIPGDNNPLAVVPAPPASQPESVKKKSMEEVLAQIFGQKPSGIRQIDSIPARQLYQYTNDRNYEIKIPRDYLLVKPPLTLYRDSEKVFAKIDPEGERSSLRLLIVMVEANISLTTQDIDPDDNVVIWHEVARAVEKIMTTNPRMKVDSLVERTRIQKARYIKYNRGFEYGFNMKVTGLSLDGAYLQCENITYIVNDRETFYVLVTVAPAEHYREHQREFQDFFEKNLQF
ncbi:MAG: hypothetical protein RDV48_27350 [Candidatus Eremiobacteraeota bacterium]|nr:hypothetical protein [Candidatus Eremiobacteraeota bacterium]